jgi:hypothetical protein
MKIFLKILFFIFIGVMITGLYLQYIDDPSHKIVIGLDILFLSFILMPLERGFNQIYGQSIFFRKCMMLLL